jgi:glycopeptide antibiotics resistance protein
MSFEKIKEGFSRAKESLCKRLICNERALQKAAVFATCVYVVVLFWALWLKFNDFHMVVLNYQWLSKMTLKERFLYDIIPFQIRFDFANQFVQFPANAIIFAPFGVAFQHAFKKKNIWRDLAICFGVSLAIEVVQLFTIIGNFATADLIMNTLGYLIGFALYRWIFSKLSLQKTVWLYRIVNALLLITVSVAIVTTVCNRELIHAILTRTL